MHDTELTTDTYGLLSILHSPEDNAVHWTFEILHETVSMNCLSMCKIIVIPQIQSFSYRLHIYSAQMLCYEFPFI